MKVNTMLTYIHGWINEIYDMDENKIHEWTSQYGWNWQCKKMKGATCMSGPNVDVS